MLLHKLKKSRNSFHSLSQKVSQSVIHSFIHSFSTVDFSGKSLEKIDCLFEEVDFLLALPANL